MRSPALPSPKGFWMATMRAYASGFSSSSSAEETIAWRSVPTMRAQPASTASGRSVTVRITSTGFPKLGASSWMPPESVRISSAAQHQVQERKVIRRLDERDARLGAEQPPHRLEHVGIEVRHGTRPLRRGLRRATSASALQICSMPSPNDSRRWLVTSTSCESSGNFSASALTAGSA